MTRQWQVTNFKANKMQTQPTIKDKKEGTVDKWLTNDFQIYHTQNKTKQQTRFSTNQKTHNSNPAKYNNSHIYCNYRQISLYTIFLSTSCFILYVIHTFTFPECIHVSWWGGWGEAVKLSGARQKKRRMSRISYETHVKYCSSQAFLSSGTVLQSAHGLFNIRQFHII